MTLTIVGIVAGSLNKEGIQTVMDELVKRGKPEIQIFLRLRLCKPFSQAMQSGRTQRKNVVQ